MKQIRLKNISDSFFKESWTLYESAFSLEEFRLLDAQVKVMKNSNYYFDVIIEEKQFIGFTL